MEPVVDAFGILLWRVELCDERIAVVGWVLGRAPSV
jgi:hypothetical protein